MEELWHRRAVGGLWDEIGQLQLDFLVGEGLLPHHRLLDVGCGSLRGGVKLAAYLNRGGYAGVDADARLLEAGRGELEQAGLSDREVDLRHSDRFELDQFERTFDVALAQSLWTHLPLNSIVRSAVAVARVLEPQGRLYATFFPAPDGPAALEPIRQHGNIVTALDADPFHYPWRLLAEAVSRWTGLRARLIGDWEHPRNQQMALFTKPGAE